MLNKIKSLLTIKNITAIILLVLIILLIVKRLKEGLTMKNKHFIDNDNNDGEKRRIITSEILSETDKRKHEHRISFKNKDNVILGETDEKNINKHVIDNVKTDYLYDILNNLSNECPVSPATDPLNDLLNELKNTENNKVNRNLKKPINDIITARTNTCSKRNEMNDVINNIDSTNQITENDINKIRNILKDTNKYSIIEINRINELLNRINRLN